MGPDHFIVKIRMPIFHSIGALKSLSIIIGNKVIYIETEREGERLKEVKQEQHMRNSTW